MTTSNLTMKVKTVLPLLSSAVAAMATEEQVAPYKRDPRPAMRVGVMLELLEPVLIANRVEFDAGDPHSVLGALRWLRAQDHSDDGVHVAHCCSKHGCKYGERQTCPVVTGRLTQAHPCETCDEDAADLAADIAAMPRCTCDPGSFTHAVNCRRRAVVGRDAPFGN